MKKLEGIPKKKIFEVPEGYFEKLPGIIQARVAKPETVRWYWTPAMKLALPVLVLVALGVVWFTAQPGATIEEQLSSIQTEQLMAYLDDGDLTMEELAETVTWSETDLIELEDKVFSSFVIAEDELDVLLEEFSIESENF